MCIPTWRLTPPRPQTPRPGLLLSRRRGALLRFIVVNTTIFPLSRGRGVPEGRGEVLFGWDSYAGEAKSNSTVSAVFGLEANF